MATTQKKASDYFFTELRKTYTSKAKDKQLQIEELGDRFAISIGDIRVAACLKKSRSRKLTMHLSKFKGESSSMSAVLKANLVSYGKAGVFCVVDKSRLNTAVSIFDTHYNDLLRVAEIRKRGF